MASFWSDVTLEPKRKYRFRLLINNDESYVVTKVKNPAVKISETPHKFLNHTFYYPGRAEWDPIDISFVDPGGADDQSAKLFEKLGASGYRNPTDSEIAMNGFTKKAAGLAVGKIRIEQLGIPGGGNTTNATANTLLSGEALWDLHNAFFTNITWGDYDYNGEEMLECSVTVRYDYATFFNHAGEADPYNKPNF